MKLIPVIDLLGGQVVRAIRGERSRYRPMSSVLCTSSAPLDVACAYLELYPFKALYLADLDAIQGVGDNRAAITQLRTNLPQLELWLDAGIALPQQLHRAREQGCHAVVGSEALRTLGEYQALRETAGDDMLLSLDFGRDGFIGPIELLQQPALWPTRVICMTLAKVGSLEGPDHARLASLHAIAGNRHIYAAGGVRDMADLARLRDAGIEGTLVASALHDGKVSAAQLIKLRT